MVSLNILGTVTHCLVGVNQKRDQDALCNKMREDSKEEGEAEPGTSIKSSESWYNDCSICILIESKSWQIALSRD